MRSTLDNNSVHQNESLSPLTSGRMHSRAVVTNKFYFKFKRYPPYVAAADARQADRKELKKISFVKKSLLKQTLN